MAVRLPRPPAPFQPGEGTTSRWLDEYAAARAWHAEHGHLVVTGESGLSNWLARQRKDYRSGRLPADRIAALEELGISWEPKQERWLKRYAEAREYVAEHGDLDPPRGHPLAAWVYTQRYERRSGRLPTDRIAALDELGMVWNEREHDWERGLAAVRAWHAEHGDLTMPPDQIDRDGFRIGAFIAHRRRALRRGLLDPDQFRALDSLGVSWSDPRRDRWHGMLAEAAEYRARHGHLRAPSDSRLRRWLTHQRGRQRAGKLDPDQIAALDAIGIDWTPDRGGSTRR